MTQSCSQIPHAVSMPALTCNNCLQQRHESDKLRLENNNLRRDLKNLKHALENSQKSEKALRDRWVLSLTDQYLCSSREEARCNCIFTHSHSCIFLFPNNCYHSTGKLSMQTLQHQHHQVLNRKLGWSLMMWDILKSSGTLSSLNQTTNLSR